MIKDKQKLIFIMGAILITTGIITAKMGTTNTGAAIGTSMIAIGAILMSINIILRLIQNKSTKTGSKK